MIESKWTELVMWLFGFRRRYRVVGSSMAPTLAAGDEVLANPFAYRHRTPERGDVVVARHPEHVGLRLIKRVAKVYPDGSYQLDGDNPDPAQNTASRVSHNYLDGLVTALFSRHE